jgi:hypothetical protein
VPKRKLVWLVFPAVGLACFASVLCLILQPDPVLLRWKLSPGQVLKYRFLGSYDVKTQAPVSGDYVTYLSVLDIDAEGIATIFETSRGPVTKETLSQFKLKPLENPYRMTPRGRWIRDKEVYRRELQRIIREQKPDSAFTVFLEMAEKDVDQYEAAKGLEDFVLPEKAVRPGDQWAESATLKNERGTFTTTHRYTLKKVEAGVATIVMEQSVELVPGSGTEFGATMQVDQILTREAAFSIDRGILLEYRQEKKNTFTIMGSVSKTERTESRTLVP